MFTRRFASVIFWRVYCVNIGVWLRTLNKTRINGLFALSVKFILGHMVMLMRRVAGFATFATRLRVFRSQKGRMPFQLCCIFHFPVPKNENSRLCMVTPYASKWFDLNSPSVWYLRVWVMNWIFAHLKTNTLHNRKQIDSNAAANRTKQ